MSRPAEPSEIDLRLAPEASDAPGLRLPSPSTGLPTAKAGGFSELRAPEESSAGAEVYTTPSGTQAQPRSAGSPGLARGLEFVATPKTVLRDLGVDSELRRLEDLNRGLAAECAAYREENERLRSSYLSEQQAAQNLATDLQVSQLLSGSLLRQNRELAGLIPVYERISKENARHRRRESESASRGVDTSSLSLSEASDVSGVSGVSGGPGATVGSTGAPGAGALPAPDPLPAPGSAPASVSAPAPQPPLDPALAAEKTYQRLYTALVDSLTALVGDKAEAVLEGSRQPGRPRRGRAPKAALPPAGPASVAPRAPGPAPANPFTDRTVLIQHYIRQSADVQGLMDQLHAAQTEAAELRRQLAAAGADQLRQQAELQEARRALAEAEERHRQLAADYQRFCEDRKREIQENKYRFMSVQKTYDMLSEKYASLKQMTQEWLESRPYRPARELASGVDE